MSGFEFEEYGALVSELRAAAPVAPERLRQRVLGLAPASRRSMSPRRRLALVVVPVAVVLSVGAAVVYGVVNSGSHPPVAANPRVYKVALPHSPATTVPQSITHGSAKGKQANPLPSNPAQPDTLGVVGNTQINKSAAENVYSTANTPQLRAGSRALAIPPDRLVHADANLEVRVPSHSALSHATNQATQIVSSLGGYAQSVRYESVRRGGGNAFLELRVPVDKAETAIARLGQLGTLVSQQISTQDLQQQLTHQTNQIGTLRRAIAVYEQALQNGSLSTSQRVELQIKLANARHAVTQLRKARSGTVASAATADISLTLETHKGAVVGGGDHKSGRLSRMFHSAVGFLALEAMIVLYALVVLSPFLLLGGLGWWLLRERRRRDERRLLASA